MEGAAEWVSPRRESITSMAGAVCRFPAGRRTSLERRRTGLIAGFRFISGGREGGLPDRSMTRPAVEYPNTYVRTTGHISRVPGSPIVRRSVAIVPHLHDAGRIGSKLGNQDPSGLPRVSVVLHGRRHLRLRWLPVHQLLHP